MLHVAVNSNYASFTDTASALNRMISIYGRTSWHFQKTDLHHGLLGRNMGGGRAVLGALCNPNNGFGLSTALQGNFSQMSSAVVWDFMVVSLLFAHRPSCRTVEFLCSTTPTCRIPNCSKTHSLCMSLGIILALLTLMTTRQSSTPADYPAPAPHFPFHRRVRLSCHIAISVRKFHKQKSGSTCLHMTAFQLFLPRSCILFFVHHEYCSGNFANLAYTFGGRYNGSGDRRATSSYTNSVVAGASNEPRRVNAVMYSHVASRPNNCLAVPTTNPSPTQKPTTAKPIAKSPTQKPSVKPPTRKPTQKPSPKPTHQPTPSPTPFDTFLPTYFPTYDFWG